ncbi:MAG: 16S rRNA (guanine(966)-N(2))-methyltransferase RsmD [Alphaproteobacteria bacterium]
MRVTAGKYGGRALKTSGDARVRPTSDKVRQAIFNILAHNDFGAGFTLPGARVIDLFAGTGAMGIEALSRGASFCLFLDDHAESRALIRENVEALGLTGVTKIWRRDATHLGERRLDQPFKLAFLDPPYRKNLIPQALASLRDGSWLAPDAIIVAEIAEDETIPPTDGLQTLDSRVYGDTRVVILLAT